jgi:CTP:molybdopterin cytidylyltransferase MocA
MRPSDLVPLVLAAGQGRRLGGNKALLDLGGTPALNRILAAAGAAGLGRPIVVLGHEAERVRALFTPDEADATVNPDPERGQTSSAQVGIRAVPEDVRAVLVWPVDHPLVTAADLTALADGAGGHPEATVVLPSHGGRAGHPVLLRSSLFPSILALPPGAPLRDLVRSERPRTHFVERPTDGVLRDLDLPADLEAARRIVGGLPIQP